MYCIFVAFSSLVRRLLEKYKLWLRQQEAFQNEEEPIEIEEALTPTEREMTENVMKKIAKYVNHCR